MTISEPRLRSLLRQAKKLKETGKLAAAEQVCRQILEEAPEITAVWLELAALVRDPAEKEKAFRQALVIDPENEAAQAGLARLLERGNPAPIGSDSVDTAVSTLQPEIGASERAAVPLPEAREHLPDHPAEEDEFDLVCYRHPDRPTALRCYTCDNPICIECAVKTPVGYSCPDCIKELQTSYYTATALDYVLAFVVAMPLSVLGAYFAGFLGFFVIFVSPVIGTLIGRTVFWAVRRHRGRWLAHLVAGTIALGVFTTTIVPYLLIFLMALLVSPEQLNSMVGGGGLFSLLLSGGGSLLWKGVYAFLAGGAAFYFIKV